MNIEELNKKNSELFFNKYVNPKLKTPIRLVEKESSKLMNFIGWFLSVTNINKRFMTSYITTIGSTIYCPKNLFSEIKPRTFIETMMHESVHALDNQNYNILFQVTYLPELYFGILFLCLSILFIALKAYAIFIVMFVLFLVAILPIPKFGRYHWEMRAYATSLIVANIFNFDEDYKSSIKTWITPQLRDSAYYFAMPFDYFYSNEKFENYVKQYPIKEEVEAFFKNDFLT